MPTASRSRRRRLAAAALLLPLVSAACIGPPGSENSTIEVETVGRDLKAQQVTAVGTIQPAAQVAVTAAVAGEVSEVSVADGQPVKAGQALFSVDVSSQQAQVDALSQPTSTGGSSGSTSGASASGNAAEEAAKRFAPLDELTRQRQALLQREIDSYGQAVVLPCLTSTPPPDTDTCRRIIALQEEILALAQHNAEVQLDAAGSSGATSGLSGLSGISTGGSSGGVNPQTEAQIEQLQRQIAAARVEAPIAGTVSLTNLVGAGQSAGAAQGSTALPNTLRRGTLVSQGQTVMVVYDTAVAQVVAAVDQADAPQVQVGQAATVTSDAYPGKSIDAKVASVAVSPSTSASGTVTFNVGISLPEGALPNWKPGISANVTITTAPAAKGVYVQTTALQHRDGATFVYRVEEGRARRTRVEVGGTVAGYTEVTGGLAPGDRVVVTGTAGIEDGQSVGTKAP